MWGGCVVESAQHTGASCFFKVQVYPELTFEQLLSVLNLKCLRRFCRGKTSGYCWRILFLVLTSRREGSKK